MTDGIKADFIVLDDDIPEFDAETQRLVAWLENDPNSRKALEAMATTPVGGTRLGEDVLDRYELLESLRWHKFPVLDDGFVCLVDVMGDDSAVVQAARVSYGADERRCETCKGKGEAPYPYPEKIETVAGALCPDCLGTGFMQQGAKQMADRTLIRYLMRHRHTTPFEMAELKFLVRVPMDAWRQWIRHRTANVNEYSTRYSIAIDSQQKTVPEEWRSQSASNKQGSGDFLHSDIGRNLSHSEWEFQQEARRIYQERLDAGVAKEQARKDLPLSTYTEAYWKIDLHNLLHFLSLRMDPHAQKEIRDYAKTIGDEIVRLLFPVVWEAFGDYRLYGMFLSRLDIAAIGNLLWARSTQTPPYGENFFAAFNGVKEWEGLAKSRERDECLAKLKRLGIVE